MAMYVLTHKPFDYQKLPLGYKPLLVGADKNPNPENFIQDNQGDNISNKNATFSELTGLYWLWKHCDDQRLGISHYRRYFSKYQNPYALYAHVMLTGQVMPVKIAELDSHLDNGVDWIVSRPQSGGPGNLWNQFKYNHHIKDLKVTREIVSELYPDYLGSFDKVMQSRKTASFYNMFYSNRDEFNQYAEWLFQILFEAEKRCDISGYDSYQQRLYGFLSERLFNVWLEHRGGRVQYLVEYNSDTFGRKWLLGRLKSKITMGKLS